MKNIFDIGEARKNLRAWGWTPAWEAPALESVEPGCAVGRVTAVFRERCLLRLSDGERAGEVTGQFRHLARNPADFPAVGDWVVLEAAGPDLALIHRLLPRRNALSRKEAGRVIQEQVLAANVDVAFVVTAFDGDFSLRRIERYAAVIRQAGMEPVVIINKSDLAGPDDQRLVEARDVNPGGTAHRLSAKTGEGVDLVEFYLEGGKTGIFLGSSGVGKSTLLNVLLGGDVQKTRPIRFSDGRGRHTTAARQMFVLPAGGLVIDTPGLREVQLWADESVLSEVFTDIARLARSCRYSDCRHGPEPGCAVKKAAEDGMLPQDRYDGYVKLQKELAYLQRKQDPVERANAKRRWKSIMKSARDHIREKRG